MSRPPWIAETMWHTTVIQLFYLLPSFWQKSERQRNTYLLTLFIQLALHIDEYTSRLYDTSLILAKLILEMIVLHQLRNLSIVWYISGWNFEILTDTT